MRSLFVLILLGVVLATVAIVVRSGMLARKHPGEPINSAMREALDPSHWSDADLAVIKAKFPGAKETTSGLRYLVRVPGDGPTPRMGQEATAHYEGRLLDGTKFDSSYDRKTPFVFPVGVGRVIRGWDEGFLAMRKGEKRTLIIPYWLGYGVSGLGKIPPRATLVFEVELLDFH